MYVDVGPGHDFDDDQSHASTVPAGASKFFLAPPTGGFAAISFFNASRMQVDLFSATDPEPTLVHTISVLNPRARA